MIRTYIYHLTRQLHTNSLACGHPAIYRIDGVLLSIMYDTAVFRSNRRADFFQRTAVCVYWESYAL